jgi:hypothetical protein
VARWCFRRSNEITSVSSIGVSAFEIEIILFYSTENDLNVINFCLFIIFCLFLSFIKSFNILVLFPVPGSQHQQDFPQLQLNAPQIPRTHQAAFQLLLKDPEKRAYEPITISLTGEKAVPRRHHLRPMKIYSQPCQDSPLCLGRIPPSSAQRQALFRWLAAPIFLP